MSDLELNIERKEKGPPHGFEIGHMTFVGSAGIASSKDPYRGVMIYISLSDLLDQLARFIVRGDRQYEFVGADSSFIVWFRRRKNGFSVWYQKKLIAELRSDELVRGILYGTQKFLANPANCLSESDPVSEDLRLALDEFLDLSKKLFSTKV